MNVNLPKLKALAQAAQSAPYDAVARNDYGMSMPPAVTLELIAEIERHRQKTNTEGCKPEINISSTTSPPNARVDEMDVPLAECNHQWMKVGEDLFTCTVCGRQKDHIPGWRDMATAPRDGTMLRLLVNFTNHSTSEHGHNLQAPTIGYNLYDDCDEDRWEFAGDNWDGSGFTNGHGEPVGWLPMLDAPREQTQPVAKDMEWVSKALKSALWHAESLDTEALNLLAWIQAEQDRLDRLAAVEVPHD